MSLVYPIQNIPDAFFNDPEVRDFIMRLVKSVFLLVENNEKAFGLYGQTGVDQAAALTTALTTVTFSNPGTPDYAIADLTNTSPYGFVSADEGQTVLSVIANLQVRVNELEAALDSTTGIGVVA